MPTKDQSPQSVQTPEPVEKTGRASSFYTTEDARRRWRKENRDIIDGRFEDVLVMSGKVIGLGQDEALECLRYARFLRQRTWFSHWIEKMMRLSDEGWLPTPMDVIEELHEPHGDFLLNIEHAREFARVYPELVETAETVEEESNAE